MKLEALLVSGQVLTYDSEEAELVDFSESHEVIDVTPEGASSVQRKLGDVTVTIALKFKAGAGPKWLPVNSDEVR